jgi:hypothetical protein
MGMGMGLSWELHLHLYWLGWDGIGIGIGIGIGKICIMRNVTFTHEQIKVYIQIDAVSRLIISHQLHLFLKQVYLDFGVHGHVYHL